MNPDNKVEIGSSDFVWRRLTEPCPEWVIGVPVLFALLVLFLVVIFRPEGKLLTALIGGAAIGFISIVYLPIAYFLVGILSWIVILIPIFFMALFYVGMMYLSDSRSVHWLWAIFLGMIRCAVYLILAIVFLLPGCQYKDTFEYESKVIVLFDVSDSMLTRDDIPEPNQKREDLKTRQEKIQSWWMAKSGTMSFHGGIVAKSPLTMYRFGKALDETDIIHLHAKKDKKELTAPELRRWLNPDKKDHPRPDTKNVKGEDAKKEVIDQWSKRLDMIDTLRTGTNIGGAAQQAHKLENNSFVQAIIIVSDGQSNLGSDEARNEFLARVNNPKRQIPVITIGVGQFRLPVSIEVQDLQAPSKTRPDDKFPVRVPVVSSGIPGEKFQVTLEVSRIKDLSGLDIVNEKWVLDPKEGTFKGAGDKQQDIVEFEIDIEKLTGVKAIDDKDGSRLSGTWKFKAKTPVHPKETSDENHEKETTVIVQKAPLRVLLFASGATREYQFLRTIFVREKHEDRMELSILLQSGNEDHIAQDVEKERMLSEFPDKLEPTEGKHTGLGDYDVIVAFDPDWSKLTKKQQLNLKSWVMDHAGGIIFVAGPVNSFQFSRPPAYGIEPMSPLYPVVPVDSRVTGIGIQDAAPIQNPTRPYALHFTPLARAFDFVKLDESGESPTAGWNGFFWNNENTQIGPGMDTQPKRGFYSYYPLKGVRAGSQVVAAFAGPPDSRIGPDKRSAAFVNQQPFIVAMPAQRGKTMYIGSGELWRLRAFKDGFHERIWIKMARFVASGGTQSQKYGRIIMARKMPIGVLQFEVQLKGKDLQPAPPDSRPTLHIERIEKDKADKDKSKPITVDLQPKLNDGDWQGYFVARVPMKEQGTYKFKVPIPGMDKEYADEVLVVDEPNPEKDNLRTNFAYLYMMSSETSVLKKTLSAAEVSEIEKYVQIPADLPPGASSKSSKRLFFQVESAEHVAKCLKVIQPKSETVKGRLVDIWDQSMWDTGLPIDAKWATILAPLVLGLVGVAILLILRQWIASALFFGICAFVSLTSALCIYLIGHLYAIFNVDLPVNFSIVLMLIVSLLGIEWLARKLLRLA